MKALGELKKEAFTLEFLILSMSYFQIFLQKYLKKKKTVRRANFIFFT